MWAISERDVFCFAIRALVAAHFIYEFVVKVFNFYQVRDTIAAAGMPVATLQLLLVLFLLTVGITLLLIGKWLKVAAVALILFQVPTTAVFEGDWYTRFDSISVLGGVLALAFYSKDPPAGSPNNSELASTGQSYAVL
mmetsp:Transcript_45154/g.106984  ORF Transcript_45154/g.106984 Transcript_45154/m.106984 type:complete len:138 (-) Transcript_45154:82-495(-)